ncbi:hypothetical protein M404DRAFT_125129 [Pisolithus tinctorius Marx 270]|uniref:Uncharacterized protein n=1 Tax=Pisolithus tinctorius Marx 270 TaxID=870435 RepID=A0A0C3PTR0_PISTI|nr:hypothetical protein M404DRAFT_125129 [Pisolithus tinctorius Marx 270]
MGPHTRNDFAAASLKSLEELCAALSHLPEAIPFGSSHYQFETYTPDPDDIELYGTTEAALNHTLEVVFAPNGRKDDSAPCPFKFHEQGPGLIAVVDVIAMELHVSPNSAVLQKWIRDLWRAAKYHYMLANQPVSSELCQNLHSAEIAFTVRDKSIAMFVRSTSELDANEICIIRTSSYIDDPEPVARGPGGRPPDPMLLQLAVRCHKHDDASKANIFRCVGTSTGCTTAWKCKNRIKMRILSHAATCEHISRELREKLDGGLAASAPSAKLLASKTASKSKMAKRSPSVTLSLQKGSDKQPSVFHLAKKAHIEQLSNQLDADIVSLFCIGGIPPSKADLPQWKTLWKHAVPDYAPASLSKLEEYHIPTEAAYMRKKQLDHLHTCDNLSITFDGQTTCLPQSVYTIHIITPSCHVFLFDGNEASNESHTGDHLFIVLNNVWTVKYFQKSTFANSHLKMMRSNHQVSHGLVSIGNTHFGTIYFSGASVQCCLPAIHELCGNKTLVIPVNWDVNESFMPDAAETLAFQLLLQQLLAVIGPPAKATKCLESAFANAADVYIYWLAVQASFVEICKKNSTKLPNYVLEQVRQLCNYRFNQMINEAPSNIFITAFYLTPSNRDSGILKHINPLAIPTIRIERTGSGHPSASLQGGLNSTLTRIGNFLVSQLCIEYEKKGVKICNLDSRTTLAKLKEQFITYAKGAWPFNRVFLHGSDAVKYWEGLLNHEDANVLAYFAVKLLVVTVNSMADEHTASTVTWLNSALRSSQKSSTIINQVQVRQWAMMDPKQVRQ